VGGENKSLCCFCWGFPSIWSRVLQTKDTTLSVYQSHWPIQPNLLAWGRLSWALPFLHFLLIFYS
jgi:hypothetical protein